METARRLSEAASAGMRKYHDSGAAAPTRELSLDVVMEDMRAILFTDRRDQKGSEGNSMFKSDART
jgi:hypothetical protein